MPQLACTLKLYLVKGNTCTEAQSNHPGQKKKKKDFPPDLENSIILAFLKLRDEQPLSCGAHKHVYENPAHFVALKSARLGTIKQGDLEPVCTRAGCWRPFGLNCLSLTLCPAPPVVASRIVETGESTQRVVGTAGWNNMTNITVPKNSFSPTTIWPEAKHSGSRLDWGGEVQQRQR